MILQLLKDITVLGFTYTLRHCHKRLVGSETYLTHVILPMLSRMGGMFTVSHAHGRQPMLNQWYSQSDIRM